jgi:hypothetical protein
MHASAPNPLIEMLLSRLERISADSHMAHRAAGVRSALAREQERLKAGQPPRDDQVDALVQLGFRILEAAGREF